MTVQEAKIIVEGFLGEDEIINEALQTAIKSMATTSTSLQERRCRVMGEYQGRDICKHQKKSKREKPCLECTKNRAINNFEPMTNADRIRNMTDEELAEFLESYSICEHCKYDSNHSCTLQNPCVHALAQAIALEWLQAEVKEG